MHLIHLFIYINVFCFDPNSTIILSNQNVLILIMSGILFKKLDSMDLEAKCLEIVLKYHGIHRLIIRDCFLSR